MFAATNRPFGCPTMYTRGSSEVCSFTDATSNCALCAPTVTPAAVTTRTTHNFELITAGVNPVSPLWRVEIRAGDDILQDPAVLLDRSDRPNVVIVARHEHAGETEPLTGDRERLPEHLGGVSPPPELRHYGVADVTTDG